MNSIGLLPQILMRWQLCECWKTNSSGSEMEKTHRGLRGSSQWALSRCKPCPLHICTVTSEFRALQHTGSSLYVTDVQEGLVAPDGTDPARPQSYVEVLQRNSEQRTSQWARINWSFKWQTSLIIIPQHFSSVMLAIFFFFLSLSLQVWENWPLWLIFQRPFLYVFFPYHSRQLLVFIRCIDGVSRHGDNRVC